MMNGVLENGNYQLGQFKFGELRKSAFWKIKMRRKIIKMFKGFDFTDFWTEDEVHDWDDYMMLSRLVDTII